MATHLLERYVSTEGRERELVCLSGAAGSRLVVDRDPAAEQEPRLLAHLAPEEPDINASLVCRHYLADPLGRYCRAVRSEDLVGNPAEANPAAIEVDGAVLTDHNTGSRYRLGTGPGGSCATGNLRWTEEPPPGSGRVGRVVSLRRVVGALESYEPARTLSAAALCERREPRPVSVVVLRAELERLATSPIVLNRLLREAVARTLEQGMTLSMIATRCGRVKRDARGNLSGETSWLGRRLGMLPEAGGSRPTPWIHSDVLALIARRGLGVSPREVELG